MGILLAGQCNPVQPDSSKTSLTWLQSGIYFATGIGTLIHPCVALLPFDRTDIVLFSLLSFLFFCADYSWFLLRKNFFVRFIIERGVFILLSSNAFL